MRSKGKTGECQCHLLSDTNSLATVVTFLFTKIQRLVYATLILSITTSRVTAWTTPLRMWTRARMQTSMTCPCPGPNIIYPALQGIATMHTGCQATTMKTANPSALPRWASIIPGSMKGAKHKRRAAGQSHLHQATKRQLPSPKLPGLRRTDQNQGLQFLNPGLQRPSKPSPL